VGADANINGALAREPGQALGISQGVACVSQVGIALRSDNVWHETRIGRGRSRVRCVATDAILRA
jgi:hypothetical protein